MAAILKLWHQIVSQTPSVDAYLAYVKNIPAKFHPDTIWNDGALDFYEDRRPSKNKKKSKDKISSDVGSVPGPIIDANEKN